MKKAELRRFIDLQKGRLSFFKWALSSEGRKNNARLRALRNRYKGKRCFIMGNGPSLLKCDLNMLAGEITIVSNAHYLIWENLKYVPTFLTVEDRLVAEDRANQLVSLEGITTLFPFDLANFLGEAGESKLYIRFDRLYKPFPKFSPRLDKVGYWGGTVSYMNLQLAHYLGCNPIIMIGFDHNYVVPNKTKIVDNVIKSDDVDVNHIHPQYFGPGYRWHDPNVARMEIGYEYANQYLQKKGVKVYNATVGGHLEVFERRDYDDLF